MQRVEVAPAQPDARPCVARPIGRAASRVARRSSVRHRRSPVVRVVGRRWPVRARKTSSSVAPLHGEPVDRAAARVDLVEQGPDLRGAAVGGDAQRAAGRGRGGRPARRGSRAVSAKASASASARSSRWPRDLPLELGRGALGDHPAAVEHRDPVGQPVGLLQVLGGQEDRHPVVGQLADDLPHGLAAARVEAGGRLVQEDHLGPPDQAGGEVEPAAHAAGVGRHPRPAGVGEVEALQQLGAPGAGRAAGQPASRPIMRRFSSPVCISSTAAYWPVRLMRAAHLAAVARRRRSPATRARPASAAVSVDRMRTVVVLPAPLGPSSANTLPRGDAQVDAAQDPHRPVGLVRPVASMAGLAWSWAAPLLVLLRMPYTLLRKVYTV